MLTASVKYAGKEADLWQAHYGKVDGALLAACEGHVAGQHGGEGHVGALSHLTLLHALLCHRRQRTLLHDAPLKQALRRNSMELCQHFCYVRAQCAGQPKAKGTQVRTVFATDDNASLVSGDGMQRLPRQHNS